MAVDYDRPVGPWLAVIGTYAMVAGLLVTLGLTARRAMSGRNAPPADEHPELARALFEEKKANSPAVPGGPLAALLGDYVDDPAVLLCPAVEVRTREGWWPERASPEEDAGYCYVSGLSEREPSGWILAFDEEWNHGGEGANVLRIGGQVEWTVDTFAPAGEAERAAREFDGRRGALGLSRPWWSRAPERPAFMPPPEESAVDRIPRAYVVIAALAFAAGAFGLGRYARRSA